MCCQRYLSKKILRQTALFHQDVDAADPKFDVNKDVVDGKLIKEDVTTSDEEAEKEAAEEEKEADDVVEVAHDSAE